MTEDYPVLGLPALRKNPFKARPLETGQSDLLVGRDGISSRWTRFLKARTERMVLLIGERGSGRSSLMRCLREETQKSAHLDMFPSDNPAQSILHEIYVSLVGFDVPSSTQEIVSRLVSEIESMDGSMPLICLDYSNVDGKKLADTMSTLIAPLERLSALVVVVLSTEQRAQWPTSLVNRFDHADVLQPLDRDELKMLCEARIFSESKLNWEMPDDALDYVLEETSGSPAKVMRLMRNIVDEERANPRKVEFDKPEIPTDMENGEEPESTNLVSDLIPQTGQFDLNLDDLEQPNEENYFEAEPSVSVSGPFGALAARNRKNRFEAPSYDKNSIENQSPKPIDVSENELWIAEEPSAKLVSQQVQNEVLEQEPENFITDDIQLEEEDTYYESSTEKDGNVEELFGKLLNAIGVPDGLGVSDLLAALRRPVIGQKESNALDVMTLRNLSKSESVLVEVASTREFSPSDSRLRDRLSIGRPRMSQMCNRLYRAGILSVQQKGRSRMFLLTNDARAQLIAWGILEVSA